MHALDPVQYSYNAEYLSAVTRTVGFYSHLYVALNVWANVWAETSYNCISVNFYLCAKQRTPKCVRRRVDHDTVRCSAPWNELESVNTAFD